MRVNYEFRVSTRCRLTSIQRWFIVVWSGQMFGVVEQSTMVCGNTMMEVVRKTFSGFWFVFGQGTIRLVR